jgi:hypothetical protein
MEETNLKAILTVQNLKHLGIKYRECGDANADPP